MLHGNDANVQKDVLIHDYGRKMQKAVGQL